MCPPDSRGRSCRCGARRSRLPRVRRLPRCRSRLRRQRARRRLIGVGGLGHLAVQYAARMGFRVVGIARGADKASFAQELGARHYVDSQSQDPAQELLKLLTYLDPHMGQFGDVGKAQSGDLSADQRDAHFATRMTAAVTAMLLDPDFALSDEGFRKLISLQRWLTILFGASPFGTGDHVLHQLNERGFARKEKLTIRVGDKRVLRKGQASGIS